MRTTPLASAALLLPGVSAQLHELMVGAGKLYFGSATDNPELPDVPYRTLLSNAKEFGSITVGNGQKWQFTQPQRGEFSYDLGDEIVEFAEGNGQPVRCHTLVWHSQLPGWVSSGSWSAADLTGIVDTHIASVAGHYRGRCYSWDVVNEALEEDGTFRRSVFYNVLGEDFVRVAFEAAGRADPEAKLYYNDYNLEYGGAKTDAAVRLAGRLVEAGAPIDGVGLQAHLIVGSTPSRASLAGVLRRFEALGLDVAYTELDIRHSSLPPDAAALARQGDDYASVVGSCLDVARCVGVTVWDYTDKYSWIPAVFPGSGAALPWDENLEPKPAYASISSVLAAAATAAPCGGRR
ncbi:glycosyl hydrolase family 10 [Paramyrothecium foliicola]|nr:glycosyl hydrolase family 10 [Paramyrothecium foliicola]